MQQQLNTVRGKRGEIPRTYTPLLHQNPPVVRISFFCILVAPPEIQLYHAFNHRSLSLPNLIIVDPPLVEAFWQQSYRLMLLSLLVAAAGGPEKCPLVSTFLARRGPN